MELNINRYIVRAFIEKYQGIIGLSSFFNVEDNSHIGMIDADNMSLKKAENLAKKLQDNYKLSDAVILSTGNINSYHIYFLDIKPFMFWIELNAKVNVKHAAFALIRKQFVLRISEKEGKNVSFVKVLNHASDNDRSQPHYQYLSERFKFKLDIPADKLKGESKRNLLFSLYNARVRLYE